MSKIYGIALNKDGEPVAGVEVELTGPDGNNERYTTGTDGIFEHEAVAGPWSLRWSASGSEGDGTLEIAQGEDAEVELEIS